MVDLHHQILVEATPQKVYDAIATQLGLRSWWTADADVEERESGEAVFGFNKRAVVFRMKIDKLSPSNGVHWSCTGEHPEWAGTKLEWVIEPGNEGTAVKLFHRGWREQNDFCSSCNSTWGELMWRLKDYVQGKNPGPHWPE